MIEYRIIKLFKNKLKVFLIINNNYHLNNFIIEYQITNQIYSFQYILISEFLYQFILMLFSTCRIIIQKN